MSRCYLKAIYFSWPNFDNLLEKYHSWVSILAGFFLKVDWFTRYSGIMIEHNWINGAEQYDCRRTFRSLFSCQLSELTTVAFKGTLKPGRHYSFRQLSELTAVAFRATRNTANSGSWHSCRLQLAELPKSYQQGELTFMSTLAFRTAKIL